MDTSKCTQEILQALRELYATDPGSVETELQGTDEYTNGKVEQAIERILQTYQG